MTVVHQAPFDLQTIREQVDAYILDFYAGEITRAEAISPDYARLWRTMLATYQAGGKRLRPYMVVLAYRACGGGSNDSVMAAAASLELLHGSMLMHDDIIDRDIVRHAKPNVAGQYREIYSELGRAKRDHLADSAALLGGDLLIMSAQRLITESDIPIEKRFVALRLLNDAVFNVAGGELLDAESITHAMADVDSLAVARYKTAHYSFVVPLVMGASLAGATAATTTALAQYGDALGIAFQLADDILGLFGDQEETGKPATSDLREGRRTYLLQQAYARASKASRAELEALVGAENISAEQLTRVKAIVRDCGAFDATVAEIRRYTALAQKAIESTHFTPDFLREFAKLIERATGGTPNGFVYTYFGADKPAPY